MAGEIASAFVRIRPDAHGFAQETEGSVRGALTSVAKIVGGIFAAEQGFQFGKDIISHASDLQKQLEAIRAEFGSASDELIKFGEKAAEALGISQHAAATTGARFGIIFENLGIGNQQAAEMTIGFEKLAGSLSLIRNVDPTTILKNIPLAIQGNLRSLKQLGISTDQTQLKIAAFKLGLTSTITEALTPTERAQAIYAIATAHLGDFQKQAAAHAGDLATRIRLLSAVWDNAKDRLGAGLLPAMTVLIGFLADRLPGALSVTGKAFRDLAADIRGIASFVAPAFRPLVAEIRRVSDALSGGGIGKAIDRIREDFAALSPAGKGAVIAIVGIAAALAAVVLAASPITAIVVGITALAIGFREAFKRSAEFRGVVESVEAAINTRLIPAVERVAGPILSGLGRLWISEFHLIRDAVSGLGHVLESLVADFEKLSAPAKAVVEALGGVGIALLAISIGAGPITVVAAVVGGLAVAFHELSAHSATFRNIVGDVTALQKPLEHVTGIVRDGLGKALDSVGGHRKAFELLGGAVGGAATAFVLLRVATAAYSAVAAAATAIQVGLDIALAGDGIGLIVIAIGALVGGMIALYTNSARVRKIVNGIFDGLKAGAAAVLPFLEKVGQKFVDVGRSIAAGVRAAIPTLRAIATALGPLFTDIGRTIGVIFSGASAIIRQFAGQAIAALTPFIISIKAIFGTVATIVKVEVGIVEDLWKRFGGTIEKIVRIDFAATIGLIRAALRIIRGAVELITGLITGDWGKAWKGLKDIAGGTLDGIKAAIKGWGSELVAIFQGIWKNIGEIFLKGVEFVVGILAKIPSVHVHIPGFGTIGFDNPFKNADQKLKAAIESFGASATDAANKIPSIIAEASDLARVKAAQSLRTAAQGSVNDAAAAVADAVGQGADSAEAAKAAADSAAKTRDAINSLTDNLNRTVASQDSGIAKARAKLAGIGTQIADAIAQQTKDVHDAVEQAKSNLASIGQTLSSAIGQILDKPIQDAQSKISAFQNRQTLENLRRSVLLPGGKQLSTDPTTALRQLRELAQSAGNINKAAIQNFIAQYQSALLTVQQDQVNVTKETTSRRIADLTDSFNRGNISLADYKKRVLAILTADRISYKKAGTLLGTAFADGFREQLKGLFDQAAAIAATPGKFKVDTSGQVASIVRPLETLNSSAKDIAKLTHDKQDAQTALQKRIAKAAETSAALQKKIASVQLGDSAKTVKKTGSNDSKTLSGTTG